MRAVRRRRRAAILGVTQADDSDPPRERWSAEWRARYLVVDWDSDGNFRLPSGGFGTLLGAYQTLVLAEALATAARAQGHRVEILDSEKLAALDWMDRRTAAR